MNTPNLSTPADKDQEIAALKEALAEKSEEIKRLRADVEEKDIIKRQDEIIGRLTRENEYLKESERRRSEWLRKAKKDAGYHDSISFDVVWAKALKLLKSSSTNTQQH